MESSTSPLFRRSLTTVSIAQNRPSVGTSWIRSLLDGGAPESPIKLDPAARRSVNFDPEASKPVSTWIGSMQGAQRKSVGFADQTVNAQKTLQTSQWVSKFIPKEKVEETPEIKAQRLLKESSLTQWVEEIVSKTDPPKDIVYKEPLKSTICGMLDDAFDPPQEEKVPTPRFVYEVCLADQVQKWFANKPVHLKQRVKFKKAEEAINAFPNPLSSKKSKSSEGLKNPHFSEFGAGSYTFNRQQRKLDFAHVQSPGPAQYDIGYSSLNKNPVAYFPTDKTERNHYLAGADSPGPAEYRPAKHFISK